MMRIDKELKTGMPSYCTGNPYVIQSLIRIYKNNQRPLLLEATANQVNQYGGYTGKTPQQFKEEVVEVANSCGFEVSRLIFGGDHLGPLVWRSEEANQAMDKAEELVREFAKAGYSKIHLDTSMQLGHERDEGFLSVKTIAQRGLRLYKACQEVLPKGSKCVYIIGSEVPFPGGETKCDHMEVTHPKDAMDTISIYKKEFERGGITEKEFDENILAIVVQPGVEFTKDKVFQYCSEKAKNLMSVPRGDLIYEGHSTDYQKVTSLQEMVKDGVKILKVGPELTFIFRAALERLENFEKNFVDSKECSCFSEALQKAMNDEPKYWEGYYSSGKEKDFQYSYLDRSRYYLTNPTVQKAIEVLKKNVNSIGHDALVMKYFPELCADVIDGNIFETLIDRSIGSVVEKYENAFQK